jgi:hypothetical protein
MEPFALLPSPSALLDGASREGTCQTSAWLFRSRGHGSISGSLIPVAGRGRARGRGEEEEGTTDTTGKNSGGGIILCVTQRETHTQRPDDGILISARAVCGGLLPRSVLVAAGRCWSLLCRCVLLLVAPGSARARGALPAPARRPIRTAPGAVDWARAALGSAIKVCERLLFLLLSARRVSNCKGDAFAFSPMRSGAKKHRAYCCFAPRPSSQRRRGFSAPTAAAAVSRCSHGLPETACCRRRPAPFPLRCLLSAFLFPSLKHARQPPQSVLCALTAGRRLGPVAVVVA